MVELLPLPGQQEPFRAPQAHYEGLIRRLVLLVRWFASVLLELARRAPSGCDLDYIPQLRNQTDRNCN